MSTNLLFKLSKKNEGLNEFYTTLFKTNEIEKWVHYIKYVFLNTDIKYERNDKEEEQGLMKRENK